MSPAQEQLLLALSPYRDGVPTLSHLTPGATVSAQNWQSAEAILPSELLTRVREGDLTITVAPTTDCPLHERYRAATLRLRGPQRLVSGRPLSVAPGVCA